MVRCASEQAVGPPGDAQAGRGVNKLLRLTPEGPEIEQQGFPWRETARTGGDRHTIRLLSLRHRHLSSLQQSKVSRASRCGWPQDPVDYGGSSWT